MGMRMLPIRQQGSQMSEETDHKIQPRHVAVDAEEFSAGTLSLKQVEAVMYLMDRARDAGTDSAGIDQRLPVILKLIDSLNTTAMSCFELPSR